MSAGYRVLVLDQRRHGETDWAEPQEYGTDYMVSDLEAFVAALQLDQYTLLGLSMGGRNAIQYAGARPQALRRLVIVDIGPEIGATGSARIQAGVRQSDSFESVDEAIARARATNPNADEGEQRHRVTHSLMQRDDRTWTVRYDKALRDPDNPRPRLSNEESWALWEQITVPTLLIRGEISDVLPEEVAAKMVETVSGCQFVEVAGSGHSVPLDRPQGFLEAARTFL
jgi:pimeloyl-ACP methyl ester carboxylesterase